jgi:hypothetical protein
MYKLLKEQSIFNRSRPANGPFPKTTKGGGKMRQKFSRIFANATLLFMVVAVTFPLFGVMAADLISCDANGRCVANINYNPAYTPNMEHGFAKLGHGTNSWTFPANSTVKFGDQMGDMNSDFEFDTLVNGRGYMIKAAAVCDVSAILHWYAVNILGMTVSNDGGEGQIPILPYDKTYWDVIYENNLGVYEHDTVFYNPKEEVTIYWSIDNNHNLTLSNSRNSSTPASSTVVDPQTITPSVQDTTIPSLESPVQTTTTANDTNLFVNWLDQNPKFTLASELGILNRNKVVQIVPWVVDGVLLFLMLFIYLLLRGWIDRSGITTVIVMVGSVMTQYNKPRGFFNRWFWALTIILYILVRLTADYVYHTVGMQMWCICFGITLFFWWIRKGEFKRTRNRGYGKKKSWVNSWFMSWIVGSIVLFLASYMWGNAIGMWFYAASDGFHVRANAPANNPSMIVPSTEPMNWATPTMGLSTDFTEKVVEFGPQVIQIAQEEDVPPEVPFVLWLKEHSGTQSNPDNGEGICGFYDLRVSGTATFPPGPISDEELLRQLRLCAQEFKKRSPDITYQTTDIASLGEAYMKYNGNIDCYGNPFPDYTSHPYVMNGQDAAHTGMIARDGKGGCVAMRLIGAIPAHYRVAQLLGITP